MSQTLYIFYSIVLSQGKTLFATWEPFHNEYHEYHEGAAPCVNPTPNNRTPTPAVGMLSGREVIDDCLTVNTKQIASHWSFPVIHKIGTIGISVKFLYNF